jgi:hypothetical protein
MAEERLEARIDRVSRGERSSQIMTQEIQECGGAAELRAGKFWAQHARRPEGEIAVTTEIVVQGVYRITHTYDNAWTAL